MEFKANIYQSIFLLGGCDLEMLEIKSLLITNGCNFYNRKLKWGAKLSDYKDILEKFQDNEDITIFGIELVEDIKPPDNYYSIDHHNKNTSKPSSLEQVAELLGVELNRKQHLIAANDKGYIPAMLNLCASWDEIQTIRRLDRKAQGITEHDELLAELSIIRNLSNIGDITIIKSFTNKFTAIRDKLPYDLKKLIIYNDNSLVYYGIGVQELANHFSKLIEKKIAYYGGGSTGFFGISDDSLNSNDLESLIDEIIDVLKNEWIQDV